MTVAAAQTSVASLKALLVGYIATITSTDATLQSVYRAAATLALDNWANAKDAAANIAASAASSYSNGVGVSLSKIRVEQAEANASRYYADFIRACLAGGINVPTFDEPSVAYWDLSNGTV